MEELIRVALGKEKADTLFQNGKIVNVLNGKIEDVSFAVKDGIIVGFGDYEAEEIVDLKGYFVAPGLIDTHLHIESTMMSPAHYAEAVMPYGVTTAIADLHEIANVAGLDGVKYMIKEGKTVPMDFRFMLPSCVPATPFENNGATIDGKDTEKAIKSADIFGLGEFMNYPGVLNCDADVMLKLCAAREQGKPVDGHFPEPTEKELNAYLLAGIMTDHECIDVESARKKLARGMYIQLREGSATRNLKDLIGLVNPHTLRRCLFCTDDKNTVDLKESGHLDNNIRIAVSRGVTPVDAITIATLNAAECYSMADRGAIAIGRIADLTVVKDLFDFRPAMVFKRGKMVAKAGKALFSATSQPTPAVLNTVHCPNVEAKSFTLKVKTNRLKVMELLPHNVVTKSEVMECNVENGVYVKTKGLAKLAVLERHKGTGNIGLGLIKNYGITDGAIALSVAHDSHNIIVLGDNDEDMAKAANTVISMNGGIALVQKDEVLGTLPLPIGGLMSDWGVEDIRNKNIELTAIAYQKLKVSPKVEPFMSLSFLSLVVIPELKITDRGLFDVRKFSFTKIEENK